MEGPERSATTGTLIALMSAASRVYVSGAITSGEWVIMASAQHGDVGGGGLGQRCTEQIVDFVPRDNADGAASAITCRCPPRRSWM
jgi:hypothetical protein